MAVETPGLEKVDLYKERPQFFHASREPELVELPEALFLVVDGSGPPDGEAFQDAIGALFSVAYTLKFAGKKYGHDFKVPTFEGAWWIHEGGRELPKAHWRWQLYMMVPDYVDEAAVSAATRELAGKGKAPKFAVRLERIRQGLCVQMMHVGPYDTEGPSIDKMRAYIAGHGLKERDGHHEVYLGDPRRGDLSKLKTLLKQPVERAVSCDLREAFRSAEALLHGR